jgi:DNA-binding MarR family transcriptional regulator
MSEFAVERARQMFQERQNRRHQKQAHPRRPDGGEPPGPRAGRQEPVADVEVIGVLHMMHSRLRRLDGWLRDEHQLNLTEMHVLSRLPATRPGQQATDDYAARLAEAVGLSRSGLTRLVDRLVDRGLLARVDDAWDKRVTHVVLTERGRTVRDAVIPRAVDQIREWMGTLSSLERLRRNTAT